MQMRPLGRTGLEVSVLGFGCGAVGGLMTRGSPADQEQAVARAIELGINYFDTAALYGDGESERNLGRVLAALKPDVVVGTKVRLKADDRGRIGAAIAESLDASLGRLGLEQVDVFHLHNPVSDAPGGLSAGVVLDEVAAAFEKLETAGKARFFGITGVGDTDALHRVVDARAFDCVQVVYNALNPSAGGELPADWPGQDYADLLDAARRADMGVIGIRALAGGALSGSLARHEHAMQVVEPIGSGADFAADVARAKRFEPLIRQGAAASLTELAMRFVIAHEAVSTMLIGYSTLAQLEAAAAAVKRGPLTAAVIGRILATRP